MCSPRQVIFACLIVSSSALQLNSNSEEGRPDHAVPESALNTSVSVAPENLAHSVDKGDKHSSMNWMSEQDAYAKYGGVDKVTQLFQEGKMVWRRSPEEPARTQYAVRSSEVSSTSSTSHGGTNKSQGSRADVGSPTSTDDMGKSTEAALLSSSSQISTRRSQTSHSKLSAPSSSQHVARSAGVASKTSADHDPIHVGRGSHWRAAGTEKRRITNATSKEKAGKQMDNKTVTVAETETGHVAHKEKKGSAHTVTKLVRKRKEQKVAHGSEEKSRKVVKKPSPATDEHASKATLKPKGREQQAASDVAATAKKLLSSAPTTENRIGHAASDAKATQKERSPQPTASAAAKNAALSVLSKVGSIFKPKAELKALLRGPQDDGSEVQASTANPVDDVTMPAPAGHKHRRREHTKEQAYTANPVDDVTMPALAGHKHKHQEHTAAAVSTDAPGDPTVADQLSDQPTEVESSDSVHLPSTNSFVSKPSEVYQSLTSKIDQLKATLAKQASEQRAAIAAQKAQYEANLTALRQNVSDINKQNRRLEQEIAAVSTVNANLREKAHELESTGKGLRRQLVHLQDNMSLVQEFIAGALVVPDSDQHETKVLRDLDEQEVADQRESSHHSALAAIRNLALLQTDDVNVDDGKAQTFDYIAQLNTSFDSLSVEHESSQLRLKQKYEEEYEADTKLQEEALAKRTSLRARLEAATTLQTQLQAAVDHLEQSVSTLRARLVNLRKYVGILSTLKA